jgi:hypothetical protein
MGMIIVLPRKLLRLSNELIHMHCSEKFLVKVISTNANYFEGKRRTREEELKHRTSGILNYLRIV